MASHIAASVALVLLAGCTLLDSGPDIDDTTFSVLHYDDNTMGFTVVAGERNDDGWARQETFRGRLQVDVVYGQMFDYPPERAYDSPVRTFMWEIHPTDFTTRDWGDKGQDLFGIQTTTWWSVESGWTMTRCFDYDYDDVYYARGKITIDGWGTEVHYDSDHLDYC